MDEKGNEMTGVELDQLLAESPYQTGYADGVKAERGRVMNLVDEMIVGWKPQYRPIPSLKVLREWEQLILVTE